MLIHGSEYTSNVLESPIVVNKTIKTIDSLNFKYSCFI